MPCARRTGAAGGRAASFRRRTPPAASSLDPEAVERAVIGAEAVEAVQGIEAIRLRDEHPVLNVQGPPGGFRLCRKRLAFGVALVAHEVLLRAGIAARTDAC